MLGWQAHCETCTHSVLGATGPPSLCILLMEPVQRRMSGCCIEPYSGCTKTSFAHERTLWPPDRTPAARGATGSFSLRIHLVADVWLFMSGCCIEQYSRFTKIRCIPDSTPRHAGMACALSSSYIYRRRCCGTSQFVCTACGACTALYVRVLYRTIH